MSKTNKSAQAYLARLKRKLDRQAIHQLRDEVVRLYEELEQTKQELYRVEQCADMWQQEAETLRCAFNDEDFTTHRRIGLTQSGEVVVFREEQED